MRGVLCHELVPQLGSCRTAEGPRQHVDGTLRGRKRGAGTTVEGALQQLEEEVQLEPRGQQDLQHPEGGCPLPPSSDPITSAGPVGLTPPYRCCSSFTAPHH